MQEPKVIIIGAGPCGMLAGLLLAKSGIPSLILERASALSTHPKAMGLTHRTLEIFRSVGLEHDITRGSLPLDGLDLAIWSKSLIGEELGRVPLPSPSVPVSPCKTLHCPQTWTERVLSDALHHQPSAQIRFNSEVTGLHQSSYEVTLTLSDGSQLAAPWVIAADGAGSSIRRLLDIPTDGPGDMGHFLNIQFRAPLGEHLARRRAVMFNTVGNDFFETFIAVDGYSRWLMHHFLQPGETPADFPIARLAEIIRKASGIDSLQPEIIGTSPWVMSPKVARFWRADRVFLVGDSAARLSPAGGLGLNTGLHGAHNLAWKLAGVINGSFHPFLLDSYDAERRPVALETMSHTNKNAEEIFAILAAAFRGDWDAAKGIIAHSRRGGSGLGQDLGTTYTSGAFLSDGAGPTLPADPINEYIPSAQPGRRAPHLPEPDGSSLLDHFGNSLTLLTGAAADWPSTPLVKKLVSGSDFHAPHFETTYGISPTGAVLVRPDGFVAARWPTQPESPDNAIQAALQALQANGSYGARHNQPAGELKIIPPI